MRKNKFVKKNIIIVSMHLLGGGGGVFANKLSDILQLVS